jgi:hypothetical protein
MDYEERAHLPVASERVADGSGVLDGRLLQVVQVRRVVHVPVRIRLVVPHGVVYAMCKCAYPYGLCRKISWMQQFRTSPR